jgi:hypothetical protein
MEKHSREEIRKSIETILDLNGKVSFSYKFSLEDWVSDVYIYHFEPSYGIKEHYYIHGGRYMGEYQSRDEAIERFMDTVFTTDNLWFVMERIRVKLGISDWEDTKEYFNCEEPTPLLYGLVKIEQDLMMEELEKPPIPGI